MTRRRFGSIRRLPSGRYQASYVDPYGRRRVAPATFVRRGDATAWLSEQESSVARREWNDPDRGHVTFGRYAARWIAERPRLRPGTVALYEGLLRNYLAPTFGEVWLSDIDPAAVRRWRAVMLDEKGHSQTMVAKAYRLFRAIMGTAADQDELIRRNPCRISGAGAERAAERPTLSVREIYELADAMPSRYRCLVIVSAFGSLRFGEATALRRRDVDVRSGIVTVRRAFAEVRGKGLVAGPPKSRASVRSVRLPASILSELEAHMAEWSGDGADGLVFTVPSGRPVRRGNFNPDVAWRATVSAMGRPGFHFHDLRHTGNTLAAGAGVSTRDLMARMGHDSLQAALIYQHATQPVDDLIARSLDRQVEAERRRRVPKSSRKRADDVARGVHDDVAG